MDGYCVPQHCLSSVHNRPSEKPAEIFPGSGNIGSPFPSLISVQRCLPWISGTQKKHLPAEVHSGYVLPDAQRVPSWLIFLHTDSWSVLAAGFYKQPTAGYPQPFFQQLLPHRQIHAGRETSSRQSSDPPVHLRWNDIPDNHLSHRSR